MALDLEHPTAAQLISNVRNRQAIAAVTTFRSTGQRYCVVAGTLHVANSGVFAAATADSSQLPMVAAIANARLSELGARATAWFIAATPSLTEAVQSTLAIGAHHEGGMQ